MTLYTASYRTVDPHRGVPIQTSIGAPRFVGYAVLKWEVVMPFGLVDLTDEAEFRRRYRHRLHSKTPRILRELEELQAAYDPTPLLLCCWEDLTKPGAWCHRTHLAAWISEHTGENIPELT